MRVQVLWPHGERYDMAQRAWHHTGIICTEVELQTGVCIMSRVRNDDCVTTVATMDLTCSPFCSRTVMNFSDSCEPKTDSV